VVDACGARSLSGVTVGPIGYSGPSLALIHDRLNRAVCEPLFVTSRVTTNGTSRTIGLGGSCSATSTGATGGTLRDSWLVCRRPRSPIVVRHEMSSLPMLADSLAAGA